MKLQKSFGTLLLGGALAISSQLLAIKPANADLLASYNFNNGLNATTSYPASQLAVSPFGASTTLPYHTSTRTATGTGLSLANTFAESPANSKATALSGKTYYSFTVDAKGNNGAKFSDLSFKTSVGTGTSADYGRFFVQANVGANNAFVDLVNVGNGGTAAIDSGTSYSQNADTYNYNATNKPTFVTRFISLSGLTSQYNGYFIQPIEFRIYQYDNNSTATSGGLRIDDVVLNGQVAPVPELPTGLLVALSLGGLCVIGMRRKKGVSPSMNMAF